MFPQSDAVLLMTCSIREGAEQKIWSRLNHFKQIKKRKERQKRHFKIGVLGKQQVIVYDFSAKHTCKYLFPLLYKNYNAGTIIMCNGLGIYCHSIISHLHHFAITVNICTLAQNSVLSKLCFPPFGSHHLIEQPPRSSLISQSDM